MASSRLVTALAGLVVSIGLSLVLWRVTGTALFFLFVPFVPFLLRGHGDAESRDDPSVLECPVCEFRTQNPSFEYCPRDGTRLEPRSDDRYREGGRRVD